MATDHRRHAAPELDGKNFIRERSWLAQLSARKPRKLVALALANKKGRQSGLC